MITFAAVSSKRKDRVVSIPLFQGREVPGPVPAGAFQEVDLRFQGKVGPAEVRGQPGTVAQG
ncbi:hypothetical protein FACS189468_5400 [Spirochaetia bacterium]|nr:hypothetical protein FACS189468_5400 [Spirochaetia bacterium]